MILLVNRSQMGYGITLYLIFSALTDIRFKTEKLKKSWIIVIGENTLLVLPNFGMKSLTV